MKIFNSVSELVGKTPLLKLNKIMENKNLCASLFAKLEYFNPAGSVKDRVARQMIEDAERSGALKKGATLIEATSGNTGIGLCAVAASMGYKVVIVMPETMSEERKKLMRAYGANLVLTDGEKGMQLAIDKAQELQSIIDGAFLTQQFENESNSKAHFESTGPEIWDDLDGKVDIFVAGVGTGGTLTGVGRYLKSKNPDIKVVAVEPADSPVLSTGRAGAHGIQGIGAGFVPKVLDTEVFDEVVRVSTEQAYDCAREIAKNEGVLVGISSGAALAAACALAERKENQGKNIVVLLADTGERYLSTELFA
ncbi:MAG: cysteine synthase A [Oscillospiraceae bacterium]|nr:cysteine synthase A [Oscillospiraceae bacterium]